MSSMRILEHENGGVTVLALEGSLFIDEGELVLRDSVNRAVAGGHANIVLDLARVDRLDSAGIGMLVCKYLTALRKGGRLKLLHLPPRVLEMLRVTRLAGVFEIFDDEDEAVRSFGAAAHPGAR
jgi:anti-sigma B factor antagonist